MNKEFKSFYFKSKIVFIDDNDSFLENLNYELCDDYLIDTYTNPQNALQNILASYTDETLATTSDLIIEMDNEETDDGLYYSIDFAKIKKLADEPGKNELISVLIIDYSMPLMNGIEFCKKIAHLPVLKIMLTGHADFKLAVDAFNAKIIDKFLVKDTEFMLEEIKSSIDVMQNLFFERLSHPLLNCLSTKKELWLTSDDYIAHLQELVKELDVVEYYLLNQSGTYLLIKEDRSRHYFMTVSDAQLEEYIEIATSYGCEANIINQLINRTHAPFFVDEADYKLPVSQWNILLQPIARRAGYYYCIISE